MSDYGHPITFGLSLIPSTAALAETRKLAQAADAAGRDASAVRRIYNVVGAIGSGHRGSGLTGDVRTWIDALTHYALDLGLDTFVFWPKTEPLAQLEVFARDVVPAVRKRVQDGRSRR